MALWTRMTRALRADVHDVLDRVESPASALRQALRDMQDAHAGGAREAAALGARAEALAARAQATEAALADLAAPLDTCLDAGRDDLARALLRRRLTLERTRTALRESAGHAATAAAATRARLRAQHEEMEALREQLALLAATQPMPPGHASPDAPADAWADAPADAWADAPAVREAEVEAALIAAKQRRERS